MMPLRSGEEASRDRGPEQGPVSEGEEQRADWERLRGNAGQSGNERELVLAHREAV
jgi:hypothetical protein